MLSRPLRVDNGFPRFWGSVGSKRHKKQRGMWVCMKREGRLYMVRISLIQLDLCIGIRKQGRWTSCHNAN